MSEKRSAEEIAIDQIFKAFAQPQDLAHGAVLDLVSRALNTFAEQARQEEREACAKVADESDSGLTPNDIAKAIRERNQS